MITATTKDSRLIENKISQNSAALTFNHEKETVILILSF